MPSIVYQKDSRSGSTYAYSSTSFRDPQTGRPRTKKEYLGRVDPETGKIVPKARKGRRNRTKLGEPATRVNEAELLLALRYRDDELERLEAEVERLSAFSDDADRLQALEREVEQLRERNALLEAALRSLIKAIASASEAAEAAAKLVPGTR